MAFSGILPDGTSVATVPEPNLAFALMGLGLWGVRETTRRKR